MKNILVGAIVATALIGCKSTTEAGLGVITLNPIPIATLSPNNAQGKIEVLNAPLGLGVHEVRINGAARLQLKFSAAKLESGQTLVIRGNGQIQRFNSGNTTSWDGIRLSSIPTCSRLNCSMITLPAFSWILSRLTLA